MEVDFPFIIRRLSFVISAVRGSVDDKRKWKWHMENETASTFPSGCLDVENPANHSE
jgi:hypothetical protein